MHIYPNLVEVGSDEDEQHRAPYTRRSDPVCGIYFLFAVGCFVLLRSFRLFFRLQERINWR